MPNSDHPWTVVPVEVSLSRVVDVTRATHRRSIETTVQELTGDWRGYSLRNLNALSGPPYWTNIPTQRLGVALHRLKGLEGLLTYSAKVPTRRNLVIFPSKLRKGSFIRFTDPETGRVYTIP